MDSNDTFFQLRLHRAEPAPASEFELRTSGTPDELRGDAAKHAVLALNISTHFNALTERVGGLAHAFVSNGYFDGSGTDELIRFQAGRDHEGRAVQLVSFNHRLAHSSAPALAVLTHYAAFLWAADAGYVRGLDEADRKLMALVFAASRLRFEALTPKDTSRIWRQLLEAAELPERLSYDRLAEVAAGERRDHAGNLAVLAGYKLRLDANNLAALRDRGIGRGVAVA